MDNEALGIALTFGSVLMLVAIRRATLSFRWRSVEVWLSRCNTSIEVGRAKLVKAKQLVFKPHYAPPPRQLRSRFR